MRLDIDQSGNTKLLSNTKTSDSDRHDRQLADKLHKPFCIYDASCSIDQGDTKFVRRLGLNQSKIKGIRWRCLDFRKWYYDDKANQVAEELLRVSGFALRPFRMLLLPKYILARVRKHVQFETRYRLGQEAEAGNSKHA